MNKITDKKLIDDTLKLRQIERETTAKLLANFHEILRRRLFSDLGYSSMFNYLVFGLNYSEGQASRRIAAARLISKNALAKKKVDNGELSLDVASQISRHFFAEKLDEKQENDLIQKLSGATKRECEKELASKGKKMPRELARVIDKDTTRISFNASDELMKKLEKVKEIYGHKKYEKLIDKMCDSTIELCQKELKKSGKVNKTKGRTISKQIKREVIKRSGGQCEWHHPQTGIRCSCKSGLEFEHIKAYAKGGENSKSNIRHYCKAHNQRAAIKEFGQHYMDRYLNPNNKVKNMFGKLVDPPIDTFADECN